MDKEKQFLDFLEDKMSSKERQKFLSALEENQALATAFEQYKALVSIEGFIAREQHNVAPAMSVKVMERIDALETKRSSMMFDKLVSKRFLFPSAALVTACVTFMLAGETSKENSFHITSGAMVGEPTDLRDNEERPTVVESDKKSDDSNLVGGGKQGESYSNLTIAEPLKDAVSQNRSASIAPSSGQVVRAESHHSKKVFLAARSKKLIEHRATRGKEEAASSLKRNKQRFQSFSEAMPPQGAAADLEGARSSRELLPKTSKTRSRRDAVSAIPSPEQALSLDSDEGGITTLGRRIYTPQPTVSPLAGEVYGVYQENPRLSVASEPVSTFSIDVDTGSFTNLRRYLSMGQLPPKDSVRIEELVNYFDYAYPTKGDKPFTVSYEIAPSPLEQERFLMKLGVQAKQVELDSELGWNLVFLVDVSGSMNSANKLPLLKRALSVLVDKMRPVDRVAIVTYSNVATMLLPSTTGANKEQIRQMIQLLRPGGGTNGSGGIDLAYRIAEQNKIEGSVNRVILATDGDFNVGTYSFEGLMNLIEKKRKKGVSLTTLGFGVGNLKEKNLEQLANRGNGNYFYLDSFKEARRVLGDGLTGNMLTIAKDVKLQVEFNPKNVLEYRLVGYDNRKLANKDFNNDKVDAGEIGSGHTVTAIYEIVLADSEYAKSLKQQLRYQSEPESKTETEASFPKELAFVKIRYKEPEGSKSKLLEYPILRSSVKKSVEETSEDFRFAAAVSYFGHLLRESKFTGDYDFKAVLELAKAARGADENGKRRELIELVANANAVSR